MHKIIIWGAGNDYQSLYNLIKYEELKGNIEVVALADKNIWQKVIDGYKTIHPDEIGNYKFDYIIITSNRYYSEIMMEALEMGIERVRLIKGEILKIPCFDFGEYVQLKENPVSIISDNCWGGLLYHYLDLPFMSPFINFWIPEADFVEMVSDLENYMLCPLNMEREGNIRDYPIGSLEFNGKKILFHFFHHNTFDEAKKEFDKRRERINWSNLFIKMHYAKGEYYVFGEYSIENVIRFDKIPYEKKICLTQHKIEALASISSVMIQNSFIHDYPLWNRYDSRNFVDYGVHPQRLAKEYNIFKLLLTGERAVRFEEREK